METANAKIPVRSHRQALDWSLVLVSQGIETVIEQSEDEPVWGLVVAAQDYLQALEVLRQYRAENRRWRWRRQVLRPGLLFDWASLTWVVAVALFFWIDSQRDLRAAGQMSAEAVRHGQWWRLFTAVWLHADLGHLATNATFGVLLIGLAMGRYGAGIGLLAAYLAGVAGNVPRWLLAPDANPSLGASGMIMGSLGLLAVQTVSLWNLHPRPLKGLLAGLFGGVMLFVLFGLAPGTDVLAHFGGFVAGVLFGAALAPFPAAAQKPRLNLLCGFLLAALIVVPWALALRR